MVKTIKSLKRRTWTYRALCFVTFVPSILSTTNLEDFPTPMPALLFRGPSSTMLNPELMNRIKLMTGDGARDSYDSDFNFKRWDKVKNGCG